MAGETQIGKTPETIEFVPDAEPTLFPPPLPLNYQRELLRHLAETEPELWKWARSADAQTVEAEAVKLGLLKTHYRLDPVAHPDLAERCAVIARRLEVAVPVTMYQEQGGLGMNAALWHLPSEAHVIFSGPILEKLHGAELDAVLAHELAHERLWQMEGGAFLAVDRLLMAAAGDPRAVASHVQTARRFRLYTEVYADRGALAGCGNLHAAVAALVKTETGLTTVSAEGYLRQADEIFAKGRTKTEGLEHPETFIRARALRMWAENDPALDGWLAQTIEGEPLLDELDLPGQRRMLQWTRRFLGELLRPRWFQTASVMAHARAFFPDFSPAAEADETLFEDFAADDRATREYWIYLLLDFSAVDGALEEAPLAAAIEMARKLGMLESFEKLATRELGVPRKQFTKLKRDATSILARAGEVAA